MRSVLEPPPSAQLIEAFANTLNLEYGTDALSTPGSLVDWLIEQDLLDRRLRLSADVHDQYLGLRGGIREVALFASIRDVPLAPSPGLPPALRPLASLALAWVRLRMTGDVLRLKRCAEHTCELVFWDLSKNRSRRWCSMRVCGNRVKSRAYAARQVAGE